MTAFELATVIYGVGIETQLHTRSDGNCQRENPLISISKRQIPNEMKLSWNAGEGSIIFTIDWKHARSVLKTGALIFFFAKRKQQPLQMLRVWRTCTVAFDKHQNDRNEISSDKLRKSWAAKLTCLCSKTTTLLLPPLSLFLLLSVCLGGTESGDTGTIEWNGRKQAYA